MYFFSELYPIAQTRTHYPSPSICHTTQAELHPVSWWIGTVEGRMCPEVALYKCPFTL